MSWWARLCCWARGHNFPVRDVRGDPEGVKAGYYDDCRTCGAIR